PWDLVEWGYFGGRSCPDGAPCRCYAEGWRRNGVALDLFEGPVEGVDQVLGVLHAHREPDETVGDARRDPLLTGHGGVGHGDGVCDQRLDRTEVLGQGPEIDGVHETLPGLDPALDLEADHGAEPGRLPLRDLVLRVRGEARVVHVIDLVMTAQELGNGH